MTFCDIIGPASSIKKCIKAESNKLLPFRHVEALVKLIKISLDQIKKRLTSGASATYTLHAPSSMSSSGFAGHAGSHGGQQPFFRSDVVLQIPSIMMMPTLEDVQSSVNSSVQTILSVCKGVPQWSKSRKTVTDSRTKAQILYKC